MVVNWELILTANQQVQSNMFAESYIYSTIGNHILIRKL